jgi:hypothetical protein
MEDRVVLKGEFKGTKHYFRYVKKIELKKGIKKNCLVKIYQKIKRSKY